MQKTLAIDIGNSYTKVGCFVEDTLQATEAFPTEKDNIDHYQEEFMDSLDALKDAQWEGVIISTVVPQVKGLFYPALTSIFGPERVLWLERHAWGKLNLGAIDITQYAPEQLGSDRVANIIAGHEQFPYHKTLICDIGTSTTFDMIDPDGRFIGGAISPGPKKFQSLVNSAHTAQLFEVDVFQPPTQTPGLTTQTNLENGLYYGYKGLMLEIFGNLLQEAQWPLSEVRFIFTGGYAQPVRDMLTMEIRNVEVDPDLTLKGLYHLWQLNHPATTPANVAH